MRNGLEYGWKCALEPEFQKSYFKTLESFIDSSYASSSVYPPQEDIFNAFNLCPFEYVSVVIIGQDPYHGPGQAHGLAFSVLNNTPQPPSLKNIFKEITTDIGSTQLTSGNLSVLAEQGVLLLNTTLTVEAGKPSSHFGQGWEIFTDHVIKKLSDEKEHLVFLLWGAHARKKSVLIDTKKHLLLEANHPSPLSAHRGFFGCKHFSQTNSYLAKHGKETIAW